MIKENPFLKKEDKRNFKSQKRPIITKSTQYKTKLGHLIRNKKIEKVEDLMKFPLQQPEAINEFFNQIQQPLTQKMLYSEQICHMKARGRCMRHKVIVGVGNQKGVIGIGSGKSNSFNVALKKASNKAKCNLLYLRYRGLNLAHYGPHTETSCKKGATRVTVRPLTGGSITASGRGKEYCALGGLENILIEVGNKGKLRKGKVRSFYNYYFSLHQCLKKQTQ